MTFKTSRKTRRPRCMRPRSCASTAPFAGADQHRRRHPRRPQRLGRHRRPAGRLRPRERRAHAHARSCLRRRHRVRRHPPLPDRRGAHRQDRSRPPAMCWRRFRRPATAATRGSPGPRAACGWGSTAIARSTRSIPLTGAVKRTIESNRFVTGVTWVDGELWHATWEGDESDIRRIDPASGAVLERLEMPRGVGVSGLESDGGELFYCGGGATGKVRAVRRPKR